MLMLRRGEGGALAVRIIGMFEGKGGCVLYDGYFEYI